MPSFRLACQVQCNWLGRLKRRYHTVHYWFACEEGHMYCSLSAPQQTAWERETFYKTLCGRGGRFEGGARSRLFASLQLQLMGLFPFSRLLLTPHWKQDVCHKTWDTDQSTLPSVEIFYSVVRYHRCVIFCVFQELFLDELQFFFFAHFSCSSYTLSTFPRIPFNKPQICGVKLWAVGNSRARILS